MSKNNNNPNWFVRVLITIFCIALATMIGYRFTSIEPKAEISSGIITLLLLILTLILSESFDNFSIGKLIEINREVKKKEEQIDKLENQNESLFKQLIAISNSQNQSQTHTNVYGDYHAAPKVEKASEAEVEEKQLVDEPALETAPLNRRKLNMRKIEQIAMQKYLRDRNIHPSNVIMEAKLVNQFQGIDPISNHQPIFDGYLREPDKEIFIEIRLKHSSLLIVRDRIYVMLSKIHYYRISKKIDAHLDLVIVNIPHMERSSLFSGDNAFTVFQPAIASGLLRIVEVELTVEEADSAQSS